MGAEVQRIAATGVVHIDVAAIQKQSLTLFCVAEGGVTAFFFAVIGFCFDNPGAEPQVADPMADDFAQQFARDKLGVAVEKASGSIVGIVSGVIRWQKSYRS